MEGNVTKEKIKPCPFCGGKAEIPKEGIPRIQCTQCGIKSYRQDIEDSVKAWNRRGFYPLVNVSEEARRRRERG